MIPKSLLAALNPTAGQIQPPTQAYQGVNNAVGYSSELGMLEDQQRRMAELQAQGAMIQPNMPTMPTMGKEEKGLLQLAKLFAIGSGIDPRAIAQEEQNYNQRRQQEIQLAHQNATQMALAQAQQQMGANKADQYRLGAEGQITEGRVKRRESDMASKAAKAKDERDHDQAMELVGARKNDPAAKIQRMMESFPGMTFAEADRIVKEIDAKQTAEKANLLGAQTGLANANAGLANTRAEDITATRDARIAKIKSATKVDDERAKNLAEETRLMPEATAIAYSRLDLAWKQFAENARQFNTREGRMVGEAAQAEVNKSLAEFNAEVKTYEGQVRKAQEEAMAHLGVTELPNGSPGSVAAFNQKLASKYAEALAILSDPQNPENLMRVEWAQKTKDVIDALRRQRQGLQQAYDKRNAIKEEMNSVPPFDPMGGGASIVGPGGQQYQPSSPTIRGKIGK